MGKTEFTIFVFIADVQASRLKIVKVRAGMSFPVAIFRRDPSLNIVFLDLSQPQISGAVNHDMIRYFQSLHNLFGVAEQFLVVPDALFVTGFAKYDLLKFEKFVNTENAFSVFAVASRFAAKVR